MIYDHAHLVEEVRYARRVLNNRAAGVAQMVEQMSMGLSLSRTPNTAPTRNIENHYHNYVAQIGPRVGGGVPIVSVETTRSGTAREEAAAGEAAVNQWVIDTRHAGLLRRLVTDYLLGWGVAGLRLDRLPGQESDDYHTVPIGFRIEREDAFWDPQANEWETRQYAGFQYTLGHDDLIEKALTEDGWNLDVVHALPKDVLDEDVADTRKDASAPSRGEVTVRELWCPRVLAPNSPKWATGTIFTLGIGAKGFLRQPRPFFGPPWGPIYLYDAYYIPGQPLGAGPCELVREQVDDVNLHADAMATAAKRRRKILVGNLLKSEAAKDIFTTPDGGLALVDLAPGSDLKEFEWDGITDQHIKARMMARETLQRSSGMDDPQVGAVTGNATATENAIANQASGVRIGELIERFASCDEMLLSGVLWYIMHTRSLRVRLRPESIPNITPEQAAAVEITVKGGMRPGLGWPDFHLRVDRRTVGRESDEGRRARLGAANTEATNLAMLAPQIAPFYDVKLAMKRIGEAYRVPDLEESIDADAAAALFGAQASGNGGESDTEVEVAPAADTGGPPKIVAGKRGAGKKTESSTVGGTK